MKNLIVTLTHCWPKHFQSEVKHTCLIGESQGSKVIFSCLSFIKASPDGFQLGGAFFFAGNWKHYSGDASSSAHIFFTFTLSQLILNIFPSYSAGQVKQKICRNKESLMYFSNDICCFNSTLFCIMLLWNNVYLVASVAKLWIFHISSKLLWEGRANWSQVVWQETLSCLWHIIPNSNSGISPWYPFPVCLCSKVICCFLFIFMSNKHN